MKWLAWLVRLFVFVAFLWFALKNTQAVDVAFPGGWDFQGVPLAAALLVAFVTGAVLGLLLLLPALISRRSELIRLRKQLESVSELRAQRDPRPLSADQPAVAEQVIDSVPER